MSTNRKVYCLRKYISPLGEMLLVASKHSLTGVYFKGQRYYFKACKDDVILQENDEILRKTALWLDRYFSGKKPKPEELTISAEGSHFRQDVWDMLCRIPYGKTITYGDIAKELVSLYGYKNMSARAVGGAVGHNLISVIIPCHRVIGANNSLTGYAGGMDKKIWLLQHEGSLNDKGSIK